MEKHSTISTVIIGGGQAGLSTSYYLKQLGQDHLILEQAGQAANAWRNDRWDSFVLNTPNWTFRMPGAEYAGVNPDGFLPRAEIVGAFEQYIDRYQLPIRYGVRVEAVEPLADRPGYRVQAGDEALEARRVVVATGLFQRPKIPPFSGEIAPHITQLHSGHYRNPQALPPGAVLVVGSGQSGCQIAEELYLSGRQVYLCVSGAGRVPRRYRSKDAFEWMHLLGLLDRTVDKLPSPKGKFAANPQLSGNDGGHALNLHQFARDGVVLLGRIQDGQDGKIRLAADLHQNLARADKHEADFVKQVDALIAQNGLDAPPENLPAMQDGYEAEEMRSLDLMSAGITTIIWATGYAFDFNLVRLPVCDGDGYPVQERGVTGYPGLFFVGLPWLYKFKSGLLAGVGEDAAYIAERIKDSPQSTQRARSV
jgi:putative flavoprotein involved in K+ transport